MKIGYARVSTTDQDLTLQRDALKKAGCKKLYEDKETGTKADRAGLADALSHLRKGDTLIVWKLDRLGRSLKNLIDLVEDLGDRGVHFSSITDGIITTTTAGKFFFHVMAALAEMERDLIAERTRAGLEAAKKRGRTGGRPARMTADKKDAAAKLLAAGTPPKDIAASLGISVPTLYRHLPARERG